MLFDGQCPLCSREVAMLKKRNARGLIAFEDIAEPGFDPAVYGLTMPQVVGSMHAVRADGSIVNGVDVFAEVYDAVGWGLLSQLIRWRVTRPLAKLGYRIFAAVRPKLSRFDPSSCENGSCKI
jgi:predicted DCC family thiol-disulfide oxidoreductase YuxK